MAEPAAAATIADVNTAAPSRTRPSWPATTVGWLAGLGVAGSAFMALAHLGVTLPLVGDTPYLAPVAVSFAVGTVLYAVTAFGAFLRRNWAWALGLVVNGLAFASTAAPPYRGGIEPVAMLVSVVALAILVSRPGRTALLGPRQPPQH